MSRKLSLDVINNISKYRDTLLNLSNSEIYSNYIDHGYDKFSEILREKYPDIDIPQYNESINWNYEYHNVLYYEKYVDFMKSTYPWIKPIKYNFDTEWKDKYNYMLKHKLPELVFSKNIMIYNICIANGQNIEILPEEIGSLTHLDKLDLSINKIAILPAEIGNLTNLTELTLNRNKLSSLPKEIGNLNKLKYLYVSYNQLTSLPKEIGLLKDLIVLDVRYNMLTSLPSEIKNLKNLRKIYINGNDIDLVALHKFISRVMILI